MTVAGLTTHRSKYGPAETMDRLAAAVGRRGMQVFARIDHAAGARAVGLTLRPTELLIFGAPQAGTQLMQAAQTIGIDLPLRALVWQDAEQATWIAYNDPAYLAGRHGIDTAVMPVLAAMTAALAQLVREAAGVDTDAS